MLSVSLIGGDAAISIRPYTLSDIQPLYEAVVESREALEQWLPWCHPTYDMEDSRS